MSPPSGLTTRRARSLGTKLALATALVLTVVGILVSVGLSRQERESLILAKTSAGRMVADLVAASLVAPLTFEDLTAVEEEVGFLKSNGDIDAVVVWNAGKQEPLLGWARDGVSPSTVQKAVGEYRSRESLEVDRAVVGPEGAVIGHVALTFSLAPENRRFARIRWIILAVSLGVALGTAALLSATVRYQVVSPLQRLARSARALRLDGVHQPVAVTTDDEIGELSRVFNRMGQAVVERAKYLQNELEIAARIQTSILPRGLDVPGLEICALMRPAAEAGGDYYEVLPTSDGAWLGIGDVTGHGLNAGLTMMMLQGMVSALVKQNENASPAALLANANRALYENVRERLGTDDHVTLTLLRYRRDGRVTCAGAHLPIVVFRAQTRALEEHDVEGVWAAIARDVAELNPEQKLVLEPGDLMVLYTDGIEEALDRNGEMFGTSRFHAALLEVVDQPLSEIVSHVIDSVVRWCRVPQDDITILVARQKEPSLESPHA